MSKKLNLLHHNLAFEAYCSGKIKYARSELERINAYENAYNHFFSGISVHPQFLLPDTAYIRYARYLSRHICMVIPFISNSSKCSILELGCGRGFLASEFSAFISGCEVIGIDIALEPADSCTKNFKYIRQNILKSLPIPPSSQDLVILDQVIEHIHCFDVYGLISQISSFIKPGGFAFIGTPNSIWGPHDISGVFYLDQPIGFHLTEYSSKSLVDLLKPHNLEFHCAVLMWRRFYIPVNLSLYQILERAISFFPRSVLHIFRNLRLLGWAEIRFLFKKST